MEFRVIASRVQGLQEYITKLNKRAAKLGFLPMTLEVTGNVEYEWHAVELRDADGQRFVQDLRIGYVTIEITGQPPRINGWTLLAVLEHTPAGNIVRRVPGVADETDLSQYNNAPAYCQHCKQIRPRKDTYVLLNESGQLAQVGSQCLKDFLGHKNPEVLAEYAGMLESLMKECRNIDGNNAIREDLDFDTLTYLAYCASAIRTYGWVSGKMAMEMYGKTSTATVASGAYNHEKAYKDIVITDADKQRAEVVRTWCLANTDESEYMHNLRTVVSQDALNYRRMGLAASVFSAYDKAMEVKALQEKQLYTPGFINNVGVKIDTIVNVVRTTELDGDFGTTYLYIMVSPDGHMLKWFASSRKMETGLNYHLHGTVKSHDVYQGKDYTTVTRCKVLPYEGEMK